MRNANGWRTLCSFLDWHTMHPDYDQIETLMKALMALPPQNRSEFLAQFNEVTVQFGFGHRLKALDEVIAEIKSFSPQSYLERIQVALANLRLQFTDDFVDNLMKSILMTNSEQVRWAELIEQASNAADAGASVEDINELFSA